MCCLVWTTVNICMRGTNAWVADTVQLLSLSTPLQPIVGPWLLFSSLILYTIERNPWAQDQLYECLYLYTEQHILETKTTVFERVKVFMSQMARPVWSALQWWLEGKNSRNFGRKLLQCHFVQNAFHMQSPGIEPEVLGSEASVWPPELLHFITWLLKSKHDGTGINKLSSKQNCALWSLL
jgi:hypothetical protein